MIQHTTLLQHLNTGSVVITPNNRLSNHLLQTYLNTLDKPSVENPACFPYTTFIQRLYAIMRHAHPHQSHPTLLSIQQTRLLWRQVITESRDAVCNEGLLDAVMSAWSTCQAWLVDPAHPAFEAKPETQQFQAWQYTLNQRLQDQNAITTEQIVNYLIQHRLLPSTNTLVWACFDDYTPTQKRLQIEYAAHGVDSQHNDLTHTSSTAHCVTADDPTHEYQQCIQWINTRITMGDKRIGVVVPDLAQCAPTLRRVLKRHFNADAFNISCGHPLTDYALIAHALQWLRLDTHTLTIHQRRLLLHSPYLIHAHREASSRYQLLQHARLFTASTYPWTQFINLIRPTNPHLSHALSKLITFPETASTRHWVTLFKERLITLGFPGDESLHSNNYQCLQRFNALFNEFEQLAFIQPSMTRHMALDTLQQLAQGTLFQPKQPPNASIQVLGLLEASGCVFDSVWVMHLTNHCLPEKTQLSAFIPIELQRTLNMPRVDATRELKLATQTLRRLQNGSGYSVFSYARSIDASPCLPSPLIQALQPLQITCTFTTKPIRLIERTEQYTIALTRSESLLGGSRLLANQAQCPFRAFAAHRLHAKAIPIDTDGLNAFERGQVLHKSLELMWITLQSQANLLTYSDTALAMLIEQSVSSAFKQLISDVRELFPPLMQRMEMQRLTRLIQAHLDIEKKRPPFKITALEQATSIELAGLRINLTLDRLDTLQSGEQWVIDYKSRLPTTRPWLEMRPDEPQLLLYALLDEAIHGLVFIELKQGHVNYVGLVADPVELPGIRSLQSTESWPSDRARWHQQLTLLAEELQQGHCPPTPTHHYTCTSCDYRNLCRIADAT